MNQSQAIETLEQYHSRQEYLGSSALKEALKSLQHFKSYIDGEKNIKASTRKAFDFGTCAHSVILENRWDQIVKGPDVSTKAVKAWKDCVEANPDKYVLTPSEAEAIQQMAEVLRAHETASKLLQGTIENSFYSQDHTTGLLVKARPDVLHENAIVDYKTTNSSIANDRTVINRVFDLGYHISAAHYVDVVQSVKRIRIQNYFLVFQETSAPYGIRVFELSRDVLDEASAIRAELMRKIAVSVKTDTFVGYDEGILTIHLPAWAARSTEGVA